MMQVQPDRTGRTVFDAGPGHARRVTPAELDHPPQSALERLRLDIQKRRAERAAASHEGEH
jgi:hypothetical protein